MRILIVEDEKALANNLRRGSPRRDSVMMGRRAVFDRFYRADMSRSEVLGTGLASQLRRG